MTGYIALTRRNAAQVSFVVLSLFSQPAFLCAQAERIVDIHSLDPGPDELIRVYGSVGQGNLSLPVAGPGDVDGDGIADILVAADQKDEDGEPVSFNSGAVYVIRGGDHLRAPMQVELDDAVLQGHIRRITPLRDRMDTTPALPASSPIWTATVEGKSWPPPH